MYQSWVKSLENQCHSFMFQICFFFILQNAFHTFFMFSINCFNHMITKKVSSCSFSVKTCSLCFHTFPQDVLNIYLWFTTSHYIYSLSIYCYLWFISYVANLLFYVCCWFTLSHTIYFEEVSTL